MSACVTSVIQISDAHDLHLPESRKMFIVACSRPRLAVLVVAVGLTVTTPGDNDESDTRVSVPASRSD